MNLPVALWVGTPLLISDAVDGVTSRGAGGDTKGKPGEPIGCARVFCTAVHDAGRWWDCRAGSTDGARAGSKGRSLFSSSPLPFCSRV